LGALVESIDGPAEIDKLVGKGTPVLTRLPDGALGFRMMTQVREIAPDAALVRLTNQEGQSICVGTEHLFVRANGTDVRANDLRPGDLLAPSWSYPPGYVLPEAEEYSAEARGRPWAPPIIVCSIEPAGRGPVFGGSVRETKSYFLTFGALSRAQA
jgi:hypothetical protein